MPRIPAWFWPSAAVPALLFTLITWQVLTGGPLLDMDARLSRALLHPSDTFAAFLADLGNVEVAVPVLALALCCAGWRGRTGGLDRWWLPPVAAAVLMALVPAFVVPLKDWTARAGTRAMPPGIGYYPSGHATTSAVAYGAATLLLIPWLRTARARYLLAAGYVTVVAGVGYGLVRRGYHWPLDVVAGWCLSAMLLSGLWLLVRPHLRNPS